MQCFTQEKDSLSIELSNEEETTHIHFSADGKNDALYLRKNFARSKSNSIDLFPLLEGEVLQNAKVLGNNRIIRLDFINSSVYAVLFGGLNSNFIAVSKNGKIFDAFKNRQNLQGQIYEPDENPVRKFEDFPKETEIVRALGSSEFMLGSIYARDILSKMNINPKQRIDEFSTTEISVIFNETEKYIHKLKSADVFYVLKNGEKYLFALQKLAAYPDLVEETTSVSRGIKLSSSFNFRMGNFLPLYKQLENRLSKKQKKLQKTIGSFDESKFLERIDKYKYFGDLLRATPNPNKEYGKEITLIGWSGEEVKITLDEKKTLIQNSIRYYDKSKSTKTELAVRKKRQPSLENELAEVDAALDELIKCKNQKQLEKLYTKFGKDLKINYQDNKMDREDKFRKFELDEGFILYVGKNAANNDELTIKFAKPNDIWMHARGSSGSHAIIRVEKGQKVPKRIIEQGAAICAYYSGQKNSKYAAVCYTEKKYVRKPKGAAVGSVTIAREKVVMVEPKQNLD
jgi:predicted ribosome quality control (RQC) complex YloA/Tae2 family protein